jgi:hypothetical protein
VGINWGKWKDNIKIYPKRAGYDNGPEYNNLIFGPMRNFMNTSRFLKNRGFLDHFSGSTTQYGTTTKTTMIMIMLIISIFHCCCYCSLCSGFLRTRRLSARVVQYSIVEKQVGQPDGYSTMAIYTNGLLLTPVSCSFLALFSFRSWWWRQSIPPKS